MQSAVLIKHAVGLRNFHIGFDPDYECYLKTRPIYNITPDHRMVLVINLEVSSFFFFFSCPVVVENKSVVPVLIPNLGTRGGSPPPSWQRIARDRNTLKLLHNRLEDSLLYKYTLVRNRGPHDLRSCIIRQLCMTYLRY